MRLKKFVKKYIFPNTVIKLWSTNNEFIELKMDWEILQNKKYNKYKVIGIKDILTESYCEAINIMVRTK